MFTVRTMSINDYDTVIALMQQTPGVMLREADSRDSTARYLERNPELSFVACTGGRIIGCLMSGHDGRRGYLQHLAVHPDYRRMGVANALLEHCLRALDEIGIKKSHIDVLKTNETGAAYWLSQGWTLRTEINRYSLIRSGSEHA